MPIDKRGELDKEPFSYKITKDKKVFISCDGRQVTILSGSKADKSISAITDTDGKEAQLVMARATGHFKHGNEKMSKCRY